MTFSNTGTINLLSGGTLSSGRLTNTGHINFDGGALADGGLTNDATITISTAGNVFNDETIGGTGTRDGGHRSLFAVDSISDNSVTIDASVGGGMPTAAGMLVLDGVTIESGAFVNDGTVTVSGIGNAIESETASAMPVRSRSMPVAC